MINYVKVHKRLKYKAGEEFMIGDEGVAELLWQEMRYMEDKFNKVSSLYLQQAGRASRVRNPWVIAFDPANPGSDYTPGIHPLHKACPFCGSSNISSGEAVGTVNGNDAFIIQTGCLDCGALGPEAMTEEDADNLWYRRDGND